MIDTFIVALADILNSKSSDSEIQAAKKRFSEAFNQLLDYRIRVAFETRRKQQSQERIVAADTINSSIKVTASTIKSLAALSTAPFPPEDITNHEELEKWMEEYKDWYENKRSEGVKIE